MRRLPPFSASGDYDADGKLLYESPYPARWLEYPILDSHLKVVTP